MQLGQRSIDLGVHSEKEAGPVKHSISLRRPRPSNGLLTKEGLVSNVGILGCAESACSENW